MFPERYTSQELEQILFEFNLGTPLSILETKFGRSAYGIALKMRALSKQYPNIWNPEKVAEYTRREIKKHKGNIKEHKRRWHARKRGEYVKGYERVSICAADKKQYAKIYREQNKGRWKEFGTYLTDLLNRYSGYKKEAAAELGIHPSLLSHYLAGNRRPSEDFLIRISERFDVPYETLLALIQ